MSLVFYQNLELLEILLFWVVNGNCFPVSGIFAVLIHNLRSDRVHQNPSIDKDMLPDSLAF